MKTGLQLIDVQLDAGLHAVKEYAYSQIARIGGITENSIYYVATLEVLKGTNNFTCFNITNLTSKNFALHIFFICSVYIQHYSKPSHLSLYLSLHCSLKLLLNYLYQLVLYRKGHILIVLVIPTHLARTKHLYSKSILDTEVRETYREECKVRTNDNMDVSLGNMYFT